MNSRVHVLSPVLFVSCEAKKPLEMRYPGPKPAGPGFEWFVEKTHFLGFASYSLAVFRTLGLIYFFFVLFCVYFGG